MRWPISQVHLLARIGIDIRCNLLSYDSNSTKKIGQTRRMNFFLTCESKSAMADGGEHRGRSRVLSAVTESARENLTSARERLSEAWKKSCKVKAVFKHHDGRKEYFIVNGDEVDEDSRGIQYGLGLKCSLETEKTTNAVKKLLERLKIKRVREPDSERYVPVQTLQNLQSNGKFIIDVIDELEWKTSRSGTISPKTLALLGGVGVGLYGLKKIRSRSRESPRRR